MAYIISIFFILFNFIISWSKKNSKIIAFLFLVFMWLLFWGNYKNADYINYYNFFISYTFGGNIILSSEIGYQLLNKVIAYFTNDFAVFRLIISLLGLGLISSTVEKYTKYTGIVYVLYFIYPFLLDIVQIRNFLAMSIFIFSIRYLISEKKEDNFKYILCILIASSIHYAAILYLPLIFISKFKAKGLIYVSFALMVISVLLMYTNIPQNIALKYAPSTDVSDWFFF